MTDCLDCKNIDFDEDDVSCKKGYDILMSYEIPDECKEKGDFRK